MWYSQNLPVRLGVARGLVRYEKDEGKRNELIDPRSARLSILALSVAEDEVVSSTDDDHRVRRRRLEGVRRKFLRSKEYQQSLVKNKRKGERCTGL